MLIRFNAIVRASVAQECIDDILHYATQVEDLLQVARTHIEKEMASASTNVNEINTDPLAPELLPQPTGSQPAWP